MNTLTVGRNSQLLFQVASLFCTSNGESSSPQLCANIEWTVIWTVATLVGMQWTLTLKLSVLSKYQAMWKIFFFFFVQIFFFILWQSHTCLQCILIVFNPNLPSYFLHSLIPPCPPLFPFIYNSPNLDSAACKHMVVEPSTRTWPIYWWPKTRRNMSPFPPPAVTNCQLVLS